MQEKSPRELVFSRYFMPSTLETPPSRTVIGEVKTRHLGRGHLVPLDGLRGMAILAVMASHLFAVNYEGQSSPLRLAGEVFYWGLWGVDLFFVLSGFLITGILVDSVESSGYFLNFYMRRVLRIFPLYYGTLLLLFALTPVLHIHWHGLVLPLLFYLQNLQRFQPLTQQLGGAVSLNHLWSLAVEEQFYLLWPLLVFAAHTPRRVLQFALTGCLLALCFRIILLGVWNDTFTTHFNVFARADTLLCGAVLALIYRSPAWPTALRWARPAFLLCGTLLVLSLAKDALWPFRSVYWTSGVRYSVVALASGALLVWSLRPSFFSRLCSARPLRFFGKYSYGLYLLHMMFLPTLSATLRPLLLRHTGSKAMAVAGSAAILVALAAGVAWLSFHLYEKRFLRLKRFFEYRRVPQPGV